MPLDILESQQSQTWPSNLQQLFSDLVGAAVGVGADDVDVGKLGGREIGWVGILTPGGMVRILVTWFHYCCHEYCRCRHGYPCPACGAK